MSSPIDAEYHFWLLARNKDSNKAYVYDLKTELLPQELTEEVYNFEEPGTFMFLDGLKFASIFLPDPVAGAILSCIVGIAESFVKRFNTTSDPSFIKLFKSLTPFLSEEYSKILEGVELLDPPDDPDEEKRLKIEIGPELKLLLKELQDPLDDPDEEKRLKIVKLTDWELELLLKENQDPPDDPDEDDDGYYRRRKGRD